MTRSDLTDITFVLDRSGSMESIKSATIEAFNRFVNSQQNVAGTALLTLVQFDDKFEQLYQAIPLQQVTDLNESNYVPRASTALLDAMGQTIVATGERLRAMPEHERPGAVVFVTLTDGLENASREFTLQRINEMIRVQRDHYSWQFIFLGANQDAIATAAAMGVAAGQAMTFAANAKGTIGAFEALGKNLGMARQRRSAGAVSELIEFDDADRRAAADETFR